MNPFKRLLQKLSHFLSEGKKEEEYASALRSLKYSAEKLVIPHSRLYTSSSITELMFLALNKTTTDLQKFDVTKVFTENLKTHLDRADSIHIICEIVALFRGREKEAEWTPEPAQRKILTNEEWESHNKLCNAMMEAAFSRIVADYWCKKSNQTALGYCSFFYSTINQLHFLRYDFVIFDEVMLNRFRILQDQFDFEQIQELLKWPYFKKHVELAKLANARFEKARIEYMDHIALLAGQGKCLPSSFFSLFESFTPKEKDDLVIQVFEKVTTLKALVELWGLAQRASAFHKYVTIPDRVAYIVEKEARTFEEAFRVFNLIAPAFNRMKTPIVGDRKPITSITGKKYLANLCRLMSSTSDLDQIYHHKALPPGAWEYVLELCLEKQFRDYSNPMEIPE